MENPKIRILRNQSYFELTVVVNFSPPRESDRDFLDRSPLVTPLPEPVSWTGEIHGGGLRLTTTVEVKITFQAFQVTISCVQNPLKKRLFFERGKTIFLEVGKVTFNSFEGI